LGSWILTHGDCDGVCSGSLALAAFPGSEVLFTHPYALDHDLKAVPDGSHVVVCDVALSHQKIHDVLAEFRRVADGGKLVYVDHHPPPPNFNMKSIPGDVVYGEDACASELVFRVFNDRLDAELGRVFIYGAMADYSDNTPLVREHLKNWDKRTLYFETGILVQGLMGSRKDHDFKRKVVSALSRNELPSGDEELVKRAIRETLEEEEMRVRIKSMVKVEGRVAYVVDPQGSLGKAAIYAMAAAGSTVGVAAETRGEMMDVSLRTADRNVNLNSVILHLPPELKVQGGGHGAAAGARLPSENFRGFIKEVDDKLLGKLDLKKGEEAYRKRQS